MRRTLLTVLACCLAAAGVLSATALAGRSSTSPPPTRAEVRAKHEAKRTAREDRIAQRLGKTGDQLRAARAAALADVLARQVQAGDRSNLPARPRAALRGLRRAFVRAVAARLGVEVGVLRAAQRAERGKHHRHR